MFPKEVGMKKEGGKEKGKGEFAKKREEELTK